MSEEICPICQEIYSKNDTPVILMADLETYGLACLNKWFEQKSTSPLHNIEIKSKHMIPNLQLIKRLNLGGLTGMGSVILPPNSTIIAETDKGVFFKENGNDELKYIVSSCFVYNNVYFNRGNRNDYLNQVLKNFPITFPSIASMFSSKNILDLIEEFDIDIEICYNILRKNPLYFVYLTDEMRSNNDIIKIAGKANPFILTMVPHPENIPISTLIDIELSIKNEYNSVLRFIPQTNEICLAIIRIRPSSLLFVENQTEEICLTAIKKNFDAFRFSTIRNNETLFRTRSRHYVSLDLCYSVKKINIPLDVKIQVITECPDAIKNIEYQTNETNLIAIEKNPSLISFIYHQTEELCLKVVLQDPNLLKYCHIHSPNVLYNAWLKDKRVLNYFV